MIGDAEQAAVKSCSRPRPTAVGTRSSRRAALIDPTAIATVGALVDQAGGPSSTTTSSTRPEHSSTSCAASGKLSVPLLPALFLTVGLEVFSRFNGRKLGWGASYDTTIGLRLHTDVAHQTL